MTSSSPAETTESVVETVRKHRSTVAPADLVLFALPALLVVGWVSGIESSVSVSMALTAAMVPALATLGYALFYDPPTGYAG